MASVGILNVEVMWFKCLQEECSENAGGMVFQPSNEM